MNAVEIEQAITDLAETPFDPANFPYAFLEAFGNKATTIQRLRTGATNKSDLGGVLQTNNIHIATCAGQVTKTLKVLKDSPATARAKAKFILATDGADFEAEDLTSGETVACTFKDFPDHFGFFLPLAGITTVRQISENAFDIRATSRLNRLYVELLKDNPEWGKAERRHDMNHFMARLIFCFFAEDTDIFIGKGRFTEVIAQMSAKDSSNTHEVIGTLFLAMKTKREERAAVKIPRWADDYFPYVNGGLFSGSLDVPRFSKIARSYLLHVGGLDWTKINPDIFGSMIQAVADDEERGELGMHYTSVPNILKVLNPLFLDDLRARLEEAGDNPRTLLNLRKRMSKIRVFDPACGSGNFLVIAYKEMRAIEAEINKRRGESDHRSELPLTNFRGIELRDFPAEIARLALVIAEYQCDVLYRGQKLALVEFLPLRNENWITCGNALRLDWLSVCPPTGTGVKLMADDLFHTPLDQAQIDFENEGGETYVCGNPPYKGGTEQAPEQKSDMGAVFSQYTQNWKSLDYVSGWFFKFAEYAKATKAACAFVSTNSVCQGEQVARLWPLILQRGQEIIFAHTSFKWSNLATYNAGVTVAIIGLGTKTGKAVLFEHLGEESPQRREVDNICPYLVPYRNIVINAQADAVSDVAEMTNGNKPADGGHLLLDLAEATQLRRSEPLASEFVRRFVGGDESIKGLQRFCLWIPERDKDRAARVPSIAVRLARVSEMRAKSPKKLTKDGAKTPHAFQQIRQTGDEIPIVIPRHSSESRPFLPVSLCEPGSIIADGAFALFDAAFWNFSILVSRIHLVWIAAVCGKLETRYRYSSTLGWNTFPVPALTEKNRDDLTRCAADILLTREHHFPATIADLYDPDNMPDDLRSAHERNDEVLERIYIGRRFKNDTERLEKLFDLYTKMNATAAPAKSKKRKAGANA
ncbi:lactate dehydrogenase [Cupriavidus necator]|uniref:class I SAM-dependent DNA methyltransferase n=1 Tax=Cupriavidus necator TaxID=106590 RepID=UPI003ECCB6D1